VPDDAELLEEGDEDQEAAPRSCRRLTIAGNADRHEASRGRLPDPDHDGTHDAALLGRASPARSSRTAALAAAARSAQATEQCDEVFEVSIGQVGAEADRCH
jgi:hypothetical protein